MKIIAEIATAILIATLIATPGNASPLQHYAAPAFAGASPPFSKAVRAGDVLYLSGVIGRTSDGRVPDGIEAQTEATMDDIGVTLKGAGLGYGDVFHCTVFLNDMKNWPAFNKVYVGYFPAGQLPARSAIGVTALALPGALMELECQAYAGRK